jgi:hypothetical protein
LKAYSAKVIEIAPPKLIKEGRKIGIGKKVPLSLINSMIRKSAPSQYRKTYRQDRNFLLSLLRNYISGITKYSLPRGQLFQYVFFLCF